jgi:hypothetical protein
MLRLLINPQEFNSKWETSCAFSDIHKSKLTITKLHYFKVGKTNICLVFSSKLGTLLMKIGFLKEKQLKETNVFPVALTIYTFLQPHRQGICKNKSQLRSCEFCFWCTSSFLKGYFVFNVLKIALGNIIGFFFYLLSFQHWQLWIVCFLLVMFFTIIAHCSTSTYFSTLLFINFKVRYETFLSLHILIIIIYWIVMTNYITHYLYINNINFNIIINTKKSFLRNLCYVVSQIFFQHAICWRMEFIICS